MSDMRMLERIGRIGHITTIDHYRGINEEVNRRTGGAHNPPLAIHSLDAALAHDMWKRAAWDEFLEVVAEIGIHLGAYGAEGVLLWANTAYVVADDVEQRLDIPVINVVAATAAAIRRSGCSTVGPLGTRYTMDLGFFRNRLRTAASTPPFRTRRTGSHSRDSLRRACKGPAQVGDQSALPRHHRQTRRTGCRSRGTRLHRHPVARQTGWRSNATVRYDVTACSGGGRFRP